MPIRGEYAEQVFIVSLGEIIALYAADNISRAIKNFRFRGYAKLSGLILNARNIENEDEIVEKAVLKIGTNIVKFA